MFENGLAREEKPARLDDREIIAGDGTLEEFAMNLHDRGTALTLAVLLTLSANAQAQRLPPDVVVSNPQVYEVTITTKFVVPRNGTKLSGLGVWHALPTARPWDGLDRTLGASEITLRTGQRPYPASLDQRVTKRVTGSCARA